MSRDNTVFNQSYSAILISVKFLGTYWEFWSEYPIFGDDLTDFFRTTRDKYRAKFGKRDFIMRLHYRDEIYHYRNDVMNHE
jgi:hypothetical protein